MIKQIFAISLLCFSAQAADYKEVKPHTGISALVSACENAASEALDIIMCPRIQKFEVKSEKGFKDLVENEFGLNLKASTPKKAAAALERSMGGHADAYREYLEHADGASSSKTFNQYLKYMTKLTSLVESLGKSKQVYVDLDTYWEPSVNAMAIVIYNADTGAVYVIMHGDTDG